jgi:predicted DNA-binding transcriptional regulator YafY
MPPQKPGSAGGIVSEALLVVWCLDKQAWRSFRLDRVKSIRSLEQRG